MPFLASEGCFWPLTASTTSEAKINYAYVITQGICNNFIEVNFCMGPMVWPPNRPLHRCTLDLFALNPFKLQHSQLVSLWKPSHCGYKKWYCHFYSCQINKSDSWLQFEKNEKNPPEGADMQKNQKQILKLLYLHYWSAPRGPRGVKRCAKIH